LNGASRRFCPIEHCVLFGGRKASNFAMVVEGKRRRLLSNLRHTLAASTHIWYVGPSQSAASTIHSRRRYVFGQPRLA
jgi:hypothetical protein